MVSRRLTKIEKTEILEEFRSGLTANNLAKKYKCSANTISRTVKTLLTSDEYTSLKEERLKIKRTKIQVSRSEVFDQEREDLGIEQSPLKYSLGSENDKLQIENSNNDEDQNFILGSSNITSSPVDENDYFEDDAKPEKQDDENNLQEIVPLVSSFGFEAKEQKVDCQFLDKFTLPEIVYMLVDKKVELDPQPISELPEWRFLPENELNRKAILLFTNQRTAKRNCSKNQRVIKIPNTSILRIYKTFLLAKGITRLILEDSLISLEN